MLQAIVNTEEVSFYQKQLQQLLETLLTNRGIYDIGYQGGSLRNTVYSNSSIWFSNLELLEEPIPRYWNAFGIDLVEHRSNSIVVEINIPVSGISQQVAGLLAKDPVTADVFLLHRGKVGGGKKGIGKDAFTGWHRGGQVEINEGNGNTNTAILITALTEQSFLENLSFFIREVAKFKSERSIGLDRRSLVGVAAIDVVSYRPEFIGIKAGKRPSDYVAECNHGRVVHALQEYLGQIYGMSANAFFNNQSIDLGIFEDNKVSRIYEVKADSSTQYIYTGIGQLMFHAASDSSITKTLVLPRKLGTKRQWVDVIARLGISLLEYEIDGEEVNFL